MRAPRLGGVRPRRRGRRPRSRACPGPWKGRTRAGVAGGRGGARRARGIPRRCPRPRAAGVERARRAFPQPEGQAAVGARRPGRGGKIPSTRSLREEGEPTHPPTLLRHSSPGRWRGHPCRPGAARSRQPLEHAAVHPRVQRPSVRRAPKEPPEGLMATAPRPDSIAEVSAEAQELERVWQAFKESGSGEARERLILHYAPLVKYVAGRLGAGLPQSVEQADLVSNGMFGLMDALDKFDRSRAVKFETYAIPRIRGAIIDELRAMDWVPRSIRSKAREVEKAQSQLEAKLGRDPTDLEVAGRLGVDMEELHGI